MRNDFEAWIVARKDFRPLASFSIPGGLPAAFRVATLKLISLGGRVAESRNLAEYMGVPSLLIQDPSLPIFIVILGASLTDKKGKPLEGESSKTELCPLVPNLEE